jgi:DNA-directed RNA polymerase specialized sigma24 family protein
MALQQNEIWDLIKRIVEKDLTSRQRFVLIASVFQSMPLDLIADKLGTNRDNVHKNLDEARKTEGMPDQTGHYQEEILRILRSKVTR